MWNRGILVLCEKVGFEVSGSDIDGKGIVTAKERFGIEVSPVPAEEIKLPKETYDVIMMRHALEHVNNPETVIKKIFVALKKGGMIYLVLPRFDCLERLVLGEYSMVCDTPRHRVHFSKMGITSLLKENGYSSIKIECKSAPSFF